MDNVSAEKDREMTKLCADAMGIHALYDEQPPFWLREGNSGLIYQPLRNDAQAMALVKKLNLNICSPYVYDATPGWEVFGDGLRAPVIINADLNRAIVECVAKMARQTG